MGKKGGKSSSKVDKAPKCTCDHPFKCVCGNRPERPSKGHKWDPTEQKWGGKGHKQKGGSGQTSSVAKEAVKTTIGQTAVEQWQKLPSQLLTEHCKKERRPNPKFKSLDDVKPEGHFKYRVIVQDAKVTKRGGDSDLFFVPAKPVANDEQAKEEAALLALLHLTPKLPHERKLPDPYKTTWLNSVDAIKQQQTKNTNKNTPSKVSKQQTPSTSSSSETKSDSLASKDRKSGNIAVASSNLVSGSNFISMSDKKKQDQDRRREKLAKMRHHENLRLANRDHQVFLSSKMRKQIETLLRGGSDQDLLDELMKNDDDEEEEGEKKYEITIENDIDDDEQMIRLYVSQRLVHEGFTKRQAQTSLKVYFSSSYKNELKEDEDKYMDEVYDECLQWLCIHLNEDQLPVGFDPRGRTLEVITSGNKNINKTVDNLSSKGNDSIESSKESNGKKPDDVAHELLVDEFGLTNDEALAIYSQADTTGVCNEKYRNLLFKTLWKASGHQNHEHYDSSSPEQRETNRDILRDELECLDAIFSPSEIKIKEEENTTSIIINVTSEDNDAVIFHLDIKINNLSYPDVYPKVFITKGWKTMKPMQTGCGTVVHIKTYEFLASLPKGEPMVYELYGFVQGILQSESIIFNNKLSLDEKYSLLPHLGYETNSKQLNTMTIENQKATNEINSNKSVQVSEHRKDSNSKKKIERNSFHRRSSRKKSFWTIHPKDTPQSIPNPAPSMKKARENLPAFKALPEFLSKMKEADENGRVMLVTGETGCGKTTQIPQFILDAAPMDHKVIVAQPRRLAATGVASRVASERGEDKAGISSVGYVVRGETAICNSTRLLFCTTGVLLRQLQEAKALDSITHIIVDEVHERHLDTDVLLGILKEFLKKVKHLRVVLMSATMDADRFAAYWGKKTPRMHIPGFTFPVKDYTLEDVLSMTGYIPPKKRRKQQWRFGGGKMHKKSPWADSDKSDDEEGEYDEEDNMPKKAGDIKKSGVSETNIPPMEELIKRVKENEIDYDLIGILVCHIVDSKSPDDDGSILVFLPGAGEISQAEDSVRRIARSRDITLLPLHGGLQPRDQQRVFSKVNRGCTKVILSTNVAETSITIPDCTKVIDTCREKQSSYDPSNRMPMLVEKFASRDSLRQRRGRAGRVRPGTCFKLISKSTLSKIPLHGEPEIKRCALEQTLLSLLFLGLENGNGLFLNSLLDPPNKESVDAAVFCLSKLGAVSMNGSSLTLMPLGMHLAGIPAPPVVGKLLIMGSMLGCRSAALSIAAGMSAGKSPFLKIENFNRNSIGEDEEKAAKNAQILREREALFKLVGNSDHAMFCAAYGKWNDTPVGGGAKKKVCQSLGLSTVGMRDISQLAKQLDSSLRSVGFNETHDSNKNANSWRIIRSLVVAALAPANLIRVLRPSTKYAETLEGAIEKDGVAKEHKFFKRGDKSTTNGSNDKSTDEIRKYHGIVEERVFMHPSTSMFSVGTYGCPWLVNHQLVRTSKPFLRDATECSSYSLLLFGGEINVQVTNDLIVIDDYVRLSANARIGALIGGLRKKIDSLLAEKVKNPNLDISSRIEMKLIVKLLVNDGL